MKKCQSWKIVALIFFSFFFLSPSCSDPDAWEEKHNRRQPPEKVMDAIGVKPGMVIGEVGAGRGRYTVKLAGRVGDTGKVYANDISEEDLEYLRHRCKRENIHNIEIILGREDDPRLPPSSLDMAFMINTYHHLEKPLEIIKNIIPALKPDATLVIVDHDPEKLAADETKEHTTSKEELLKEAGEAGFELVRIETFLERDSIYILRLKNRGGAPGTAKPVLHARHWVAITGKPLAATAGAMIFQQGGNAVDAACAMLGVTCTMFDVLSWGGETQALIYDPHKSKIYGINALGVAPTGATPEFFLEKGMSFPPKYGPLAAVTPGTLGGLMVMLAEYGTMSLKEVLEPSIQMAEGYPIEQETADSIEKYKEEIKKWPYSKAVLLPHLGKEREAPHPGEIFRQPDLHKTLLKLVEAEQQALNQGKNRKEAIYAAYDRFYRGDIAEEFVRSSQEKGGLHTMKDLSDWQVYIEEPVKTEYKGIEIYKLTSWVQGPVMLQALNILENIDLKSMEYNCADYIHTLYQVMNLAFADRDFYYGDPYFPPEEPIQGLLSKEYAKKKLEQINWERNEIDVKPGDPYPFEGKENPYTHLLEKWLEAFPYPSMNSANREDPNSDDDFFAGTTSIQAADKEGWIVSVTPSGGWIPATIAGKTGIGMSQRMQSFVLTRAQNPFNVVEPGKRPRATLTPGMAFKDGKPFLSFAVQGGDTQDQNLLQFFLNVVEFGMNVQEAVEAPNITSFQMHSSFGDHKSEPGRLRLNKTTPPSVREKLSEMGYQLEYRKLTSGPINAIFFDWEHGTMRGGSSNYGEDYGIAW